MGFRTKEDAIHFAEKQGQFQSFVRTEFYSNPLFRIGWDYYV